MKIINVWLFQKLSLQAMPIKFAVKIVRLRVCMTIASPMTITFIQGHKCLKLDCFLTCNISDILSYYIQTWHDGRLVDALSYLLMLVLVTLTLMQVHSGSAKAKSQRCILSATKQAISIKLATTVGHFFRWPWPRLPNVIWLVQLIFFCFLWLASNDKEWE